MHLRSYNPYDRYRNRSFQRVAGFVVVAIAMAAAAMMGFFLGRQHEFKDEMVFSAQVATLTAEKEELERVLTELKAESITATTRYEQLQQTYQETVPEGPVQELIALVNTQIAGGMDPERLAFLIRSARPPRNCTDPETIRFVVSTPAYKGPASQASLAEGGIVIKGSGASARNTKGEPEAWYDPSQAVTLQFTMKDGKVQTKKAAMPIQQSIVLANREYRFTVAEGARSFAKVTYDSCDYP